MERFKTDAYSFVDIRNGGFVYVDKGSPSSSRRAYQLTRKGREVAQW